MLVSPRWHRGFDKGANSKPATQSWWYKPDSWYQACDQRDCFASLAMTPQMAVIARSGATKQSRCEARWRESSVWFRPLVLRRIQMIHRGIALLVFHVGLQP